MRRQIFVWAFTVVVPLLFFTGVAADDLSAPGHHRITVVSNEFGSDELVTYDLDGGNPTRFGLEGVTGFFPAWSPDGRMLLMSTGQGIVVCDTAGESTRSLISNGTEAAWSSDGRYIAYVEIDHSAKGVGTRHDLVIFDVVNETQRTMLKRKLPPRSGRPSWKPFPRGADL